MRTAKVRIRASSLRWLIEIDDCIRRYDMRGVDRLLHAASDALDGLVYGRELDDLCRRGLLRIVKDGPGADTKRLAGYDGGWSAQLTERAICALWPDMLEKNHVH